MKLESANTIKILWKWVNIKINLMLIFLLNIFYINKYD